jgi:hypothetical protein
MKNDTLKKLLLFLKSTGYSGRPIVITTQYPDKESAVKTPHSNKKNIIK